MGGDSRPSYFQAECCSQYFFFYEVKPLLDNQKVSPCHCNILPKGKVGKEGKYSSFNIPYKDRFHTEFSLI